MSTAATGTTATVMDHGRTGDVADKATGMAAMETPPVTVEGAMTDGALALVDHLRPTRGTATALSHR